MGTGKDDQVGLCVQLPDLLVAAGLSELPEESKGEEASRWLREFGARAPVNAVDRGLYRDQGVQYLGKVGFGSPASLVEAAFKAAVCEVNAEVDTRPVATEDELLDEARPILEAEDHLALFAEELRLEGFAGDTTNAELLYLALTSRHLDRPVNVVVLGPSGSGKTHLVNTVLAFHPDEAAHRLTAASQKALLYTEADTEHAFVVISEGDALVREGVGATVIREISWSSQLRYEVSIATPDGVRNQVIEKPGPTGLITTSTHPLESELTTRMLEVHVPEDEAQTRAIMESLALEAAGVVKPSSEKVAWHAAQRWLGLKRARPVAVPFGPALAHLMPADLLRMRRDFRQVLSLIEAHAFLHQRRRDVDDRGWILADRRDYVAMTRLLTPVFQRSRRDGLTEPDRRLFDAVVALNRELPADSELGASVTEIANRLELDKSAVSRRASRLERQGHLENLDKKTGTAHRYVLSISGAQETSVFPSTDVLFKSEKGQ